MSVKTIELQEYRTLSMPATELPEPVGTAVWKRYGKKVNVEFPSPKTANQWQLTPEGWAGHIPVDEEVHLFIKPKVQLDSLFRMLEYAYKLDFLAAGDMIGAASLQEFYNRLAKIVALRVLDRSRKGFYREYVARNNRLPYLRGKVALESMLRTPWESSLDCRYHENTADIEDNHILTWTLFCIARSGLCHDGVAKLVRRAFRATQGIAQLKACSVSLCKDRHYNRLNEDYQSMHALCRFFLDHSGPSHEQGHHHMLPFLIDMSRLFESFVAEWLCQHLPESIILKDQATLSLGGEHKVDFRIDLLLIDRKSGKPLCLLDTKYKVPTSPSSDDIQQVIAYAKALGCPEAVLVYPQILAKPFDDLVGGDIHVWTTAFTLTDDLEANGFKLMEDLLSKAMAPTTYYSANQMEKLRGKASAQQVSSDEYPDGWSKSKIDPMKVLDAFSTLHTKRGFVLRAYQYVSGGSGNGVVWGMPEDSAFPGPDECSKLEDAFLECPRPPGAVEDVMEAIEGDGSDLSYLYASLCAREISGLGAMWHGCSWSSHSIVDEQSSLDDFNLEETSDWDWPEDKPKDWRPSVLRVNDKVIVSFYTYTRLGSEGVVRHTDTFSAGSYCFVTDSKMIANGPGGCVY